MLIVVVCDLDAAAVHLFGRDGGQRLPGQLQPAHDGLEPLEGQRRPVVVHLDDPVGEASNPGETTDPHNQRYHQHSSGLTP